MTDGEPPTDERAEVVVVGGGHNGLVCAAYLAKAGVDVMVVEANDRCGGTLFSSRREGFTLEHGAIDHSTILASSIVADLQLERHGLHYLTRTRAAVHCFGDGTTITIAETAEETASSIAALDSRDAAMWVRLADLSPHILGLSGELISGRPIGTTAALRAGKVAFGRAGREILDLATTSAVTLAEQRFHNPHVRALAIFRSQLSGVAPWEPGTGAVFCLTPAGHGRRLGRPEGGSAALVDALTAAVVGYGGRIVTSFPVTSIGRIGAGFAIRSDSHRRVTASRAVVSAAPPQDTILRLFDGTEVPTRLRRRYEQVVGVSGNLSQFSLAAALTELPPSLRSLPPGFTGTQLWLMASPEDVLAVPTAAMTGTLAARPAVLATFPSIIDPCAAPAGAATVWINGFTSHRLAQGDWSSRQEEALEGIWATVESCLPGVHARVVDSSFHSPDDLSRWTHAENPGQHVAATIDQLFARRPVAGAAQHRSGIRGLYLTGAGTNPGPSVSGLPGRASATAVLEDLSGPQSARAHIEALSREWARAGRLGRTARRLRRGG